MPYDLKRAPRYALALPMRFRLRADLPWRRGQTKNISASGVFFVVDAGDPPLHANTPLEMNLVMPQEIVGAQGTHVACHGSVVRTCRPDTPDDHPRVAATIVGYRIVRGDPG